MKTISGFRLLFSLYLGLCFYTAPLNAQSWQLQSPIIPLDSNIKAQDNFGMGVALTDSFMLIGSPNHEYDENGDNRMFAAGAAYIFQHDLTGIFAFQKLAAPDRSGAAAYGHEVAMNENWAVVSAFQSPSNSLNGVGQVYIYAQEAGGLWVLDTILAPPQAQAIMQFGISISLYQDALIIGAAREKRDANEQNDLTDAGAAYYYEYDAVQGWQFVQKLVASDRSEDARFGVGVALYDNVICVGAPDQTLDPLTFPIIKGGQVYVYEKDSTSGLFSEVQILRDQSPRSLGAFGTDLALWENELMVGETNEGEYPTGSVPQAGMVEVYQRDATGVWQYEQALVPQDLNQGGLFGRVDLQGDLAIVGAYGTDIGALPTDSIKDGGAAYVFERINDQWQQVDKFAPSDRMSFDKLGDAIAINGSQVLVGGPFSAQDAALFDAGEAWLYQRDFPLTLEPQRAKLKAWPNPVQSELRLEWPEQSIHSIQLFDLYGQSYTVELEHTGPHRLQLSLGHLSPGLYLLSLTSQGGGKAYLRLQKQ
ncbi:MAG: T9SS type A sorting domain-containing protein [Bacteroidota bacterium]